MRDQLVRCSLVQGRPPDEFTRENEIFLISRLKVNRRTVEGHCATMMKKIRVTRTDQLPKAAVQDGMIRVAYIDSRQRKQTGEPPPDAEPPLVSKLSLSLRSMVGLAGTTQLKVFLLSAVMELTAREKLSMAVGSDREICRRPAWQRPSLERHVNDLELASIDVMIEMGAVHVPSMRKHSPATLTEGEVRHIISSTLFVANVDPAKIYAYLSTGYLVTVENVTNWNPRQLTAWDNAIAAYRESNAAHA